MEISQLQAFIAVVHHASFSQAAEALFVTQPAISKRIANLESQLNCRLFDRLGHRVVLTASGQTLIGRARHIVLQWQDCRRLIGNLSGSVCGRINFATSHHIGLHRLPPVLRCFGKQHPAVELNLKFLNSEIACKKVAQGDFEFALVTLPLRAADPLQLQPVWRDPLAIVVGKQHTLCHRQNITAQQLAALPGVFPSHGTVTREIINAAFQPAVQNFNIKLCTNYLETIKMLVSIDLAWGVLPHTLVDSRLRVLSVAGINMQRHLGIVRHKDITLSNAAAEFIRLVTAKDIHASDTKSC